jgi:hypothetical protein
MNAHSFKMSICYLLKLVYHFYKEVLAARRQIVQSFHE